MWPSPYPSHTLLNLHFVIPTLPFVIAVISSRLFSARAARFSHSPFPPFCGEGVAGGREGGNDRERYFTLPRFRIPGAFAELHNQIVVDCCSRERKNWFRVVNNM